MERYLQYDLRGASFEEFVDFLFDHAVAPKTWYAKVEVEYDPYRALSSYTRLFSAPRFLLSRFSKDQLEQGFWAVHGPALECSASNVIWEQEVPFDIRERCVRAMFHLFADLFAEEPFTRAANMWWDSLAYAWHCGNRKREKGGEDRLMQDVMFETLAKILEIPSEPCQVAALHGLGHLHHPDTSGLIQGFLGRNGALDPKVREYAKAAARFEVL
jgi:hypothetical protein